MDQLKETNFEKTLTEGGFVVYNIPPKGNLPVRCTPVSNELSAWQTTLGSCNPYVVADQNTKTIAVLYDKIVGEITERAIYTTLVIIRTYLRHWNVKPEIIRARTHCAYIICDGDSPITSSVIKGTLNELRSIII